MEAKIVLSLNEEMTRHLCEEIESRRAQIEKFCSGKPGADKTIEKIDNFLATLSSVELKLEEVQDEDDVDYFLEELIYIIECVFEI